MFFKERKRIKKNNKVKKITKEINKNLQRLLRDVFFLFVFDNDSFSSSEKRGYEMICKMLH